MNTETSVQPTDAVLIPRLEAALRRHGCSTGTLHWRRNADSDLELLAQVGLPAQVVKTVAAIPIGKGMAGLAALRNEPVQTCDLQLDTSGDIRPGARAVPVQASVAIPIISAGDVVGVLGFARGESHVWSAQEIAEMTATANEFATNRSA